MKKLTPSIFYFLLISLLAILISVIILMVVLQDTGTKLQITLLFLAVSIVQIVLWGGLLYLKNEKKVRLGLMGSAIACSLVFLISAGFSFFVFKEIAPFLISLTGIYWVVSFLAFKLQEKETIPLKVSYIVSSSLLFAIPSVSWPLYLIPRGDFSRFFLGTCVFLGVFLAINLAFLIFYKNPKKYLWAFLSTSVILFLIFLICCFWDIVVSTH